MIKNPLISVVIPVYNRSDVVLESLESVKSQTYSNWECVIIDDGSEDGTQEVIKSFIKEDFRFKFFLRESEPKGASACRNIGLKIAVGQYIIFLDSDDLLAKDCLEKRLKMAIANPEKNFWVFRTAQFNNKVGDSLTTWNVLNKEKDDLQRFILQDAPWHTMGPMWLKRTLTKVGGFDESALCWQDWELHIRVLLETKNYWKSNDDNIDSFYRNNRLNKWNTISKDQNNFEHILFRVKLFKGIYSRVTSVDHRKEIRIAFSVLFYRVIKELKQHNAMKEINGLLRYLINNGLFSSFEIVLIWLVSINSKSERINRIKERIINKLFRITNENVFFNQENKTFQS